MTEEEWWAKHHRNPVTEMDWAIHELSQYADKAGDEECSRRAVDLARRMTAPRYFVIMPGDLTIMNSAGQA